MFQGKEKKKFQGRGDHEYKRKHAFGGRKALGEQGVLEENAVDDDDTNDGAVNVESKMMVAVVVMMITTMRALMMRGR